MLSTTFSSSELGRRLLDKYGTDVDEVLDWLTVDGKYVRFPYGITHSHHSVGRCKGEEKVFPLNISEVARQTCRSLPRRVIRSVAHLGNPMSSLSAVMKSTNRCLRRG